MTFSTASLGGRAQSGFTLVELLVSMCAGIIVIGALYSILVVTLHQTQRDFNKADASRRARTALATIENELHSSCLDGSQAPPVQAGSDPNTLIFLSFTGTAASPTPTWHQITFDATGKTLIDTAYSVSGSAPNWTQNTQVAPMTTTLLTNVALIPGKPVFQYFQYEVGYTDPSGNQYMVIPDGTNTVAQTHTTPVHALDTPLVTTTAGTTVEVMINVLVGADPGTAPAPAPTAPTAASMTDAVSLRLTTPENVLPSGMKATAYGPCL